MIEVLNEEINKFFSSHSSVDKNALSQIKKRYSSTFLNFMESLNSFCNSLANSLGFIFNWLAAIIQTFDVR